MSTLAVRSHITLRPSERSRVFNAVCEQIRELRQSNATERCADQTAPLIADILNLAVIRQIESAGLVAQRLGYDPRTPSFAGAWEAAGHMVDRLQSA